MERLTDAQVSDLLDMALTSELGVEIERLWSLPSKHLVREVRTALEGNDLGLREASFLLAVNELTPRSWLDASKTLPEVAHQKLAAVGLLLKAATAPGANQEIASLARMATSLAKGLPVQQVPAGEEHFGATSATFEPSGLMAAALWLGLRQQAALSFPLLATRDLGPLADPTSPQADAHVWARSRSSQAITPNRLIRPPMPTGAPASTAA